MSAKYLHVTWQDSGYHVANGWQELRAAMNAFTPKNLLVETVGILADEDDDVIVLGLSYSESTKSWFGLQIIAKEAIKNIEEL